MDGCDTEEHEDDCFRGAAQHLHGVLQRRLRVWTYVVVDVTSD
jgi:hypothetical protein